MERFHVLSLNKQVWKLLQPGSNYFKAKTYIWQSNLLGISVSGKIAGIQNYCDRWCERCPMTANCEIFMPNENQHRPMNFMDGTLRSFDETYLMLETWAAKRTIRLAEIATVLTEEELKRREKNRRNPRTNETSKLAFDYRMKIADLTRKNQLRFDEYKVIPGNHEKVPGLDAALQTIIRQEAQIAAKITRAYIGLVEHNPDSEDLVQNDHNGSAKVALIGIEKSFPAWEIISALFPDLADECWTALLLLDKIRKRILTDFPRVAEFVRPGFDAVIS
jgi:hypothetical protein